MGRKRDRTEWDYASSHPSRIPYSFPKRRRPPPPPLQSDPVDSAAVKQQQPTTVVIVGLPSDCSVLDLKSRFEIYGSISRTRMDPNGLGYITFRSHDAAQSAVFAAVDPSFAITLLSKPVQVMWASDAVPQWRDGVTRNEGASSSTLSSKLVRPELPLSRRGRENKLGSAIVNPRDENKTSNCGVKGTSNGSKGEVGDEDSSGLIKQPLMGREIVAYDDIL